MTVRPELAVAVKVSGVPTVWVGMAPNAIVCANVVTSKLIGTAVAAAYVLFPDCDAVMVHVPLPVMVTVAPETLHTLDGVAL